VARTALGNVVAVAALALAGCGGEDDEAERRSAPAPRAAAITVPAAAAGACRALAADATVRVLCPPAGGRPAPIVRLVHEDLEAADPCAYLVNMEAPQPDPADARPWRVLVGGRCGGLPLRADADGLWPAEGPESLRLVGSPPLTSGAQPRITRPRVLRRIDVRGHPGLLLHSKPFPEGGFQGGHSALVWIEDGTGYLVSARWRSGDRGRLPRADQVAALQRLAASLRPA
jgi:hypothetical protein